MKYLWLLILLCQPGWADVPNLKVQTFNAYGPIYAREVSSRTMGLVKVLESQSIDVIGFQEVWNDDHFQDLKTGLNVPAQHGSWIDFDIDSFHRNGLKMLTQGEILRWESFPYPINKDGILDEVRDLFGVIKSIGMAWINHREVGNILVVNTHTHPMSVEIRLSQIIFLADAVNRSLNGMDHLIVMGDFNATPDSTEYQLLRSLLQLKDAYVEVHGSHKDACTYCKSNTYYWGGGNRTIDFIFYRSLGPKELKITKADINLKSFNNRPLSDHYGVYAEFSLMEQETAPSNKQLAAGIVEKTLKILSKNPAKFKKPIKVLTDLKKKKGHQEAQNNGPISRKNL